MSDPAGVAGGSSEPRDEEARIPPEPEAEIRAQEPRAREQRAQTPEPTSIGHLLSRLVDDVAVLVRKELALATSEVSHSIDQAKAGAGAAASGGAVLYAGVLFLLLAATFGLAEVMADWAAALVVGGVVTLIGLIMFRSGKRKMSAQSFAPTRAARSVRKDVDLFERQKDARQNTERQTP